MPCVETRGVEFERRPVPSPPPPPPVVLLLITMSAATGGMDTLATEESVAVSFFERRGDGRDEDRGDEGRGDGGFDLGECGRSDDAVAFDGEPVGGASELEDLLRPDTSGASAAVVDWILTARPGVVEKCVGLAYSEVSAVLPLVSDADAVGVVFIASTSDDLGGGKLSCAAGIGLRRPLDNGASGSACCSSSGVIVVDDHGTSGSGSAMDVRRLLPDAFAGDVGSSSLSSSSLRTSLPGDEGCASSDVPPRLLSATLMFRLSEPSLPIAVTQPFTTSLPSKAYAIR